MLQDAVPCHTLQYYADHSNFTSNAVFYFLEGDHWLQGIVQISGAENLSLVGTGSHQDSNKILCKSATSGFLIEEYSDLVLRNLEILHCGSKSQIYSGAFVLSNGTGLTVESVTVSESSGYGMVVYSTQGHSSINSSLFSNNRASTEHRGGNAMFFYSECLGPNYLSVHDSRFLDGYELQTGNTFDTTGGLSVIVDCNNVKVTITDSIFTGNTGYIGANLQFLFFMLTGNSVFIHNVTCSNGKGDRGAGIHFGLDEHLFSNDPLSCDETHFHPPHQLITLEQVYILNNTGVGVLFFEDRILPSKGKQRCAVQYVTVKDSVLSDNHNPSWLAGTAVRFSARPYNGQFKTLKTFQAAFVNVTFAKNKGNALQANISVNNNAFRNFDSPVATIYAEIVPNITFIDCIFENNLQTAIIAVSSTLTFQGTHFFRNNSAYFGSGITLMQSSFLFLKQNTHIIFSNNHAISVGGALYMDLGPLTLEWLRPLCFFQVLKEGPSNDPISTIHVDFMNNTADYAGSSIYGVQPDCNPLDTMISGSDQFKEIFNTVNTEADPSAISSDPESVCFCLNYHRMPDCSIHSHSISVYPGEDFILRLAVVSGFEISVVRGTVPGAIHAFFNKSNNASFGPLQDSQTHPFAYCKNFTYTVLTTDKSAEFFVGAVKLSFQPYNLDLIPNVIVSLKDCPLGFSLSHDTGKCVCDPVLRGKSTRCFINNQTILRPPLTWIGFVNGTNSNEFEDFGVVFHDHCAPDFCLDRPVYLNHSDPDIQCAPHRTGLLCGKCKEGYSITLGIEKCSKCSNVYLLLLLPICGAGIILVILLFALNLTVTEGSINALIFYANVIEMAQSKFYTGDSVGLHVFIAWLNLDFGIDTCFFAGMDAYSKTWLQFVFPLYLWVIIVIIVLVCNKFPAVGANRYGQNALKVLATLLLLSYTKLQRIIVTIFSFTTLNYPSGTSRYVWLYDANVDFLKGKHLYLFVVGMLVLVTLILPYTLGLAFFQQLQACSSRKGFKWVNKLKPVFDSYAGPYKDRYRVWTGFLLAIRTALIVLFSINTSDSPEFNLFIIIMVSLILLSMMASFRGIYKKWPYDILESFFYLQLGIFAGGLMYTSHNHGNGVAVVYFSYGSCLLTFLVIVVCRVCSCLPCMKNVYHRWRGYEAIEVDDPIAFHSRDE